MYVQKDRMMISRNLRHLRLVVAVADTGSLTLAADQLHVSQPAVTQAIGKLERESGGILFDRTRQGLFVTPRGAALIRRLKRAFALLDPALGDVSPRLRLTATSAQLQALVAVHETENFTLAARRLGLAQPTVHRAVSQLEQEAGRSLFERTAYGMVPSRQTRALVGAVMLSFRELDQAEADLSELDGGDGGHTVVGALPLARSVLLPQALSLFRLDRPHHPLRVVDGRYDELLGGLRRGDLDVIVGALRQPPPIGDIIQEELFVDQITFLAGNHHPLVGQRNIGRDKLRRASWVVPQRGTPSREQFDRFFADGPPPASIIEGGSILLMRGILDSSNHLGCISGMQAKAEVTRGLVSEIHVTQDFPGRPIGLTYRASWSPTQAQNQLLERLRAVAKSQTK
jgi:DNA-binding transcriptional LysR family regulator